MSQQVLVRNLAKKSYKISRQKIRESLLILAKQCRSPFNLTIFFFDTKFLRDFHQNLLGHPFSAWGQDSERFCGVEKLDRNIPQDVFWMLKIWRNIWAWSHWLGKILLSEFLKVKLPILLSNKDCIYLSDNTIGIIRALENYFHILSSDFWESQICRKEIFLKDALISRYVLSSW